MLFLEVMGGFAALMSVPLLSMYARGQFVGQRPPSGKLKLAVLWIVGLGLLFGVGSVGPQRTFGDWMLLAWMAGAALAAHLAHQDCLFSSGPSKPTQK